GDNYGRCDVGADKKVMVEFISANPTGPLHIGHGRQAIIGDVLARSLEAVGYEVTREYYYNDAGNQMNILGISLWIRYQQLHWPDVVVPEGFYEGDYMCPLAEKFHKDHGDEYFLDSAPSEEQLKAGPEEEKTLALFRQHAADNIVKLIDHDLRLLGIKFDSWKTETSLHDAGSVDEGIDKLRERGHIYEKDGATWFRSSDFGDEKDRVVVRSNGFKTYMAPDIAYHMDKHSRGFDQTVNILGADHHGYTIRLKGAIEALSFCRLSQR
ncbi:arginine--tRNA ligase, partial [Candidatus Hydrogenedentota bacterium]